MNALILLKVAVESDVPLKMTLYGNSMLPFIRSGDSAIIKSVYHEALNIGDLYAFVQSGSERLIIHRMVKFSVEGCEMKGDNCNQSDGIVPISALIGKITRVERRGRLIFHSNSRKNRVIAHLSRLNIPFIFQHSIDLFGKVQRRVKRIMQSV